MSSESNNGKGDVPAVQSKPDVDLDPCDLDKNPIQYATYDGKLVTESHDKAYMELTLRGAKHGDLVKRILRQRIEARAKEFPRWPASVCGGVRSMWIESKFLYDRERLGPDFDDDWRSYRARYLHSLELDPREPVHVPEYEKSLINPIRRFYMKGGDWLEQKLIRRFVPHPLESAIYRVNITRGIMVYFAFIGIYYYVRFHERAWDASTGIDIYKASPVIYPGHPDYPFKEYHTEPGHFYDRNFSRRKIYRDLRDYEDTTVVI